MSDESSALTMFTWIVDKGINGVPPLSSAESLAQEYLIDGTYYDHDERVSSLINWEMSKNFTTGFITGLGGLLTLPVSIPAALGASWIIQARMAGAIACIYGHSTKEDRVRTLAMLSIFGDAAKEILKEVGIKVANKITYGVIKKIPGKLFIELNKAIGFRLITKAGEKSIISVTKMVPIAGGFVGGCFDAVTCRIVGHSAKTIFQHNPTSNVILSSAKTSH